MKKKDVSRIKEVTTKKLSDFIRLEEGSTGKQNALKAGAVLSGSVLSQVLLSALNSAEAVDVHRNGHTNQLLHESTPIDGGHSSAL
ncbi:MAG: hypothetical protein OXU51_25845 [Candidatus Poribacteria bacterium]|nr:hypothetical protein [Candidatus Poribacteria bacterium]